MKLFRRLLAGCLSVMMTLAVTTTSITAASFSDVADNSQYKQAVDSLVSLGLLVGYEDGTFRPDATITRAEFAAVMTRAMGQEEVAKNVNSAGLFTDMATASGEAHWATGYVRVAYNLGIIVGMGDGTFAPDAPVTYEQAVKMIVCALGYEQMCIDRGGWPNGYLTVANEIGVTKAAIIQPSTDPAPRGMVAKLLYNSLTLQIMEKTSSGNYGLTDKTLLTSKIKTTELKNAMVVAVDGVVSLSTEANSLRAGEMVLEASGESAKYKYGNVLTSVAAKNLLGYYVNVYYRYDEDTDERILVSIDSSQSRNKAVVVKSQDIDDYSPAGRILSYFENEDDTKAEDITIASNAKFIYNGAAFDYGKDENSANMKNLSYWLSPSSGSFFDGEATLLDSGSDGDIDVIFMYDYQTFVVKESVRTTDTVDSKNYIVNDYYTSGYNIRLDPNERDVSLSIINASNNAEMSVSSLQAYDILSVAKSMDGKSITCYVSRKTISGTIKEILDDRETYTINNTQYKLTPEFLALVKDGKENMTLGMSATFYLDRSGRIAATSNVSAQQVGNYAYLVNVTEKSGANGGVSVKLMRLDTLQVETKSAAEKIKINGNSMNSTTDSQGILNAIEAAADKLDSNSADDVSSATYTQLVRYTLDSSQNINAITTTDTLTDGALDMGSTASKTGLKLMQQAASLTYVDANNFAHKIRLNSDTKIISVPNDRKQTGEYKMLQASAFEVGNAYSIEGYNVDANAVATVLLVYGGVDSSGISADTPLCLVKAVGTQKTSELDPDGGVVYEISVYQGNESGLIDYETADANAGSAYNQVKVGDIVRFGFNNLGQINDVEVVLDSANRAASKHAEGVYESTDRLKWMFGTVNTKAPNGAIHLAPALLDTTVTPPVLSNTDQAEYWNILSNTKVYQVQLGSSNPVTESDDGSIIAFDGKNANASTVFAYMYKKELKMIVIYVN